MLFMPDIFKTQHWLMFLNVSTVVPSPAIEMLGNNEAVAQPVMSGFIALMANGPNNTADRIIYAIGL